MIFGKVVANARDEREIAGIDASCFQRKSKEQAKRLLFGIRS